MQALEPEDTPEVSSQDELEQESVLQELLPAAVLRKRKEQSGSHEASLKRPRIGVTEEDGFSRGRRGNILIINHAWRDCLLMASRYTF